MYSNTRTLYDRKHNDERLSESKRYQNYILGRNIPENRETYQMRHLVGVESKIKGITKKR